MSSILTTLLHTYYKLGFRGFCRLNELLNAGKPLRVKNRFGVLFDLLPDSYIDSFVLKEGFYESEIIEALSANIVAGSIVWDVGANFGLHAVTLQKLFPEASVIAFEPLKEMQRRIRENAALNGLQIAVEECALSNETAKVSFFTNSTANTGRSSLIQWDSSALDTEIKVESIRADELILSERCPFPNIIKIDVEGLELQVLEGFGLLLQDPRLEVIVFEANVNLLEQTDQPKLRLILEQAEFSLERLERNEDSEHDLANFIAKRPKR